VHISASFDSGNIEVIDATDPDDVRLAIVKDEGGEHSQWFHFRVSGLDGGSARLVIENAHTTSYPKAWEGYQAVASVDRQTWIRLPTTYADGQLIITVPEGHQTVTLAYFAPYSHERHLDLIGAAAEAGAQHEVLGRTLDGRDLDLLTIGDGDVPVWVIARQHPGESMAEWWMEGFLARLLDDDDALARALKAKATFFVVPNMNPDGSHRGHLRTNAVGANLNREWVDPTMERAPEVKLVLDRMDQTGVFLSLDVHGDEELPYNFIAGPEGVPSWNDAREVVRQAFEIAYETANPDFQRAHGYGRDEPGKANMTMHTNQVAERFGALAMTLEMPFKDNADAPDEDHGWSPERAMQLGAAALHPIAAVL
jgi:murein tripeptide amidase MpaA